MSFFDRVPKMPPDPILGLTVSFRKDPRPDKVNLTIGLYQTEDGKIPLLSCVRKAEEYLCGLGKSKEYLPIDGDPSYLDSIADLIFDKHLHGHISHCLTKVQTLGGAGALRLGAEFIHQIFPEVRCHIPSLTWPNHLAIFAQANIITQKYPYYDKEKKEIMFLSLCDYLSSLTPHSLVLFHVCCHNPSGADFSKEEWQVLATLCKEKELLPFFDAAYLGFDCSFEEDAFPLRLFAKENIPFLAAVSFSKNFSLYAERVGAFFLFSTEKASGAILSQLKVLVRRNYSNPPIHGAQIVAHILQDSSLQELWKKELEQMKKRIYEVRALFVSRLTSVSTSIDYSYILKQKGFFSFCDLSELQVDKLITEYGIYMTSDGRMNVAGLNSANIDAVVKALVAVGGNG